MRKTKNGIDESIRAQIRRNCELSERTGKGTYGIYQPARRIGGLLMQKRGVMYGAKLKHIILDEDAALYGKDLINEEDNSMNESIWGIGEQSYFVTGGKYDNNELNEAPEMLLNHTEYARETEGEFKYAHEMTGAELGYDGTPEEPDAWRYNEEEDEDFKEYFRYKPEEEWNDPELEFEREFYGLTDEEE